MPIIYSTLDPIEDAIILTIKFKFKSMGDKIYFFTQRKWLQLAVGVSISGS